MKITIKRTKQVIEKNFSGTGEKLLRELGLNSEDTLIIKNNELVDASEKLANNDVIDILYVASGG